MFFHFVLFLNLLSKTLNELSLTSRAAARGTRFDVMKTSEQKKNKLISQDTEKF